MFVVNFHSVDILCIKSYIYIAHTTFELHCFMCLHYNVWPGATSQAKSSSDAGIVVRGGLVGLLFFLSLCSNPPIFLGSISYFFVGSGMLSVRASCICSELCGGANRSVELPPCWLLRSDCAAAGGVGVAVVPLCARNSVSSSSSLAARSASSSSQFLPAHWVISRQNSSAVFMFRNWARTENPLLL